MKKTALLKDLNYISLNLERLVKDITNKIKIVENIAITPNSLFNIDLSIA